MTARVCIIDIMHNQITSSERCAASSGSIGRLSASVRTDLNIVRTALRPQDSIFPDERQLRNTAVDTDDN